jgi:hypothetical protein
MLDKLLKRWKNVFIDTVMMQSGVTRTNTFIMQFENKVFKILKLLNLKHA